MNFIKRLLFNLHITNCYVTRNGSLWSSVTRLKKKAGDGKYYFRVPGQLEIKLSYRQYDQSGSAGQPYPKGEK